MRNKKILGALAVAASAALVLSGCSTTADEAANVTCEDKPVEKILFDYPFTALPVYSSLVAIVEARAAEQGVEVVFTNDDMDLAKQVTNLNSYMNQDDIDAVVSFPADPASLESIAKQYMDKCKYWVSYGGDLDNQHATLQFSFEASGRMLGEDAGKWINENLGGEANILVLEDQTIQIGQERSAGLVAGLSAIAPNAKIVATEQAITPDQGLTAAAAALAKNPEINVVVAAVGDAAQGAYQALVAAGRSETDAKVYVGGIDPNLFLVKAMKEGKFVRAIASFSFVDLANSVIDVPIELGNGNKDASVDLPASLITPASDLDTLIAQLGG